MAKHFEDAVLLEHIIEAIDAIQLFISNVDKETFMNDLLIQSAVIRQFEIMGEAAKALSSRFKTQHPDIVWEEMTGMRNKLIHDYFGVELEVVWDTIQKDLPDLQQQLLPLVKNS